MLLRLGDVEGAHDMLAKVYNMQLEQAELSQEDPAVLATTARSAGIMLAEKKFADAVQCYQSVSLCCPCGATPLSCSIAHVKQPVRAAASLPPGAAC